MATWTDEQIAQALAIAAAKGPAQAARETGIPAGTIKSWRNRKTVATAPAAAQPQGTAPDGAGETAATALVPRDERGHFLPGVSGNPSGQTSAVREAKRRAEEYAPDVIDELLALARNPAIDSKARVAAYREVLDRGLGRPRQAIDLTATTERREEHDITARILADDGTAALAEQLLRRAAGRDAGPLCVDGEWREVDPIRPPAAAEPEAGGGGDGAL